MSGLCMGIRLARRGIEDFLILEKSPDIGGTWHDNTYPGACSDVPAVLYSYSFAPNPDWSRLFPPHDEIKAYFRNCAEKFGLLPRLRLSTTVERADWQEEEGLWKLQLADGEVLRARSLVSALGQLNVPNIPDFPGRETFAGRSFHSARWDHDTDLSGSPHLWDDYAVGEKIDHADGMTLEEAEHQMATRLYQNTAKVHFDQVAANENRFGRRIVYGGHVISMARALSFNGLANAFRIVAVHAGKHVKPTFAGDTLFAWTEVLDKAELPGRADVGVLRLKTRATKNRPAGDFPAEGADGKPHPAVVLEFDYSVLMARRRRR